MNFILLDGDLVSEPTAISNGYKFYISSSRFCPEGEETVKESSEFEVETYGRLGEICKRELHIGRGVLLIGLIAQKRESEMDGGEPTYRSRVVIVAEHVEFKPAQKRPQPVNQRFTNDGAEWMGDHDAGL